MAKARARINRYFEAFDQGSMKPQLSTQKVQDLNARLEELQSSTGMPKMRPAATRLALENRGTLRTVRGPE